MPSPLAVHELACINEPPVILETVQACERTTALVHSYLVLVRLFSLPRNLRTIAGILETWYHVLVTIPHYPTSCGSLVVRCDRSVAMFVFPAVAAAKLKQEETRNGLR